MVSIFYTFYILDSPKSGDNKQLQDSFKIQSSKLFIECALHMQSNLNKGDVMTIGMWK